MALPADTTDTPNGPPPAGDPVEERLRRIETAIASLHPAPPPGALAVPPGVFIDANGAVNPPAPPLGAVLRPPEAFEVVAHGFWLFQAVAEFRLAARMYFDPRYRLSRVGQFALPGAVAVLVLNYLFFNWVFAIPVLSPVVERTLILVVAVVFYKLLLRELARYRGVLDYMSRYGFR